MEGIFSLHGWICMAAVSPIFDVLTSSTSSNTAMHIFFLLGKDAESARYPMAILANLTIQCNNTRKTLRSFICFAVVANALLLNTVPAQAQQRVPYSMATPSYAERQRVTQTIVRYLAAWNEPDPQRRRALIEEVIADDGSYIDPNRHGVGYQEIDALMRSAQKAFPGYKLRLVSTIDLHHDGYVRFSWAAGGMPDAPVYLAGTDFVRLAADGRIQSVVGFGDAAAVQLPIKP
jgi:SnoaL-like domain